MAGGFLHKLFGRAAAPPPDVAEALAELARHAQERPALAGPIALLQAILPQLYQQPPAERPPAMSAESAAAKLAGGIPLLRGESLEVDLPSFGRRWEGVCEAVAQHQNPQTGKALAEAVRGGRLELRELVQAVLAGRPEGVHARADSLGLDAGLAASVLGLALFPVLAPISDALAPLRHGIRWEHGYCPICGSWPLLGEFRGLEQTRFLRCGLCVAEWEFPRLLCPFCGNRDHQLLGYFGVEGEESRVRAARCDACRSYVKMVATVVPLSGPRLLVADVATLHLDLAAAQRGYAVPP